MRLAVTGVNGQVARSLQDLAAGELVIVALGRPQLDLSDPQSVAAALRDARPDVVVNAAAYTAVDQAESERDIAFAVNEGGAGAAAGAAAALGAPIVQLSTDYVFDGGLDRPYVETDATAPLGVYGASKLAGERAVAAAHADHVIVRASWVYSPHGVNFVRTMLRLAETRDEIAVVADQCGGPTSAADLARAIVTIAHNLRDWPADATLRGVFHLGPQGEATWSEFARAIFEGAAARGGPSARVQELPTSDYPTRAKRPANSRLDASKLAAHHGVRLPPWRQSLAHCLDALLRPA